MTATTKLVVIVGVLTAGLIGWIVAGYPGAATGLVLGIVVGAIPLAPSPAVVVADSVAPAWSRDHAE